MIKLFKFLLERKSFMLFLLLEFLAFIMLINNNLYIQYKNNDILTSISGTYNNRIYKIKQYFKLKKINDKLLEENNNLKNSLQDSTKTFYDFKYWKNFKTIPAYIISNQYQFLNNFLLINKGDIDSVKANMPVVGTKGIIGTIMKVSPHYSAILSILNHKTSISVKTKYSNHYGFLKWNGKNPNVIEVVDIPFNAKIKVNDTIVTSGNSTIFPKNIPVGVIIKYKKLQGNKNYQIYIKPIEDLTNLEVGYVLINKNFDEINKLKDSINEF